MRTLKTILCAGVVSALVNLLDGGLCPAAMAIALTEGTAVDLGGRIATLRSLDTLPYVQSDYNRRFRAHAQLTEVRRSFEETVVPWTIKSRNSTAICELDWRY